MEPGFNCSDLCGASPGFGSQEQQQRTLRELCTVTVVRTEVGELVRVPLQKGIWAEGWRGAGGHGGEACRQRPRAVPSWVASKKMPGTQQAARRRGRSHGSAPWPQSCLGAGLGCPSLPLAFPNPWRFKGLFKY